MNSPTIPLQQRLKLGERMRLFGDQPSFLDLCRGFARSGVTIETVKSSVKSRPHELAMASHGKIHTFREFGLAEDVARWLRRWDDVDFDVPLSADEQLFIVARERWIRANNCERDLPQKRWVIFGKAISLLGLDMSEAAMKGLCSGGSNLSKSST